MRWDGLIHLNTHMRAWHMTTWQHDDHTCHPCTCPSPHMHMHTRTIRHASMSIQNPHMHTHIRMTCMLTYSLWVIDTIHLGFGCGLGGLDLYVTCACAWHGHTSRACQTCADKHVVKLTYQLCGCDALLLLLLYTLRRLLCQAMFQHRNLSIRHIHMIHTLLYIPIDERERVASLIITILCIIIR